ncbi:MAG: hypothetical protein M0C28_28505 [Candidatus Moduliflexus flocculans]|nr:hypothetical protein [Candidatus Moduliflexus flocculans]
MEALIEMLYGITEGTAGKWSKADLPMVCHHHPDLVLACQSGLSLIPGNETIGIIHEYDGHGVREKELFSGVYTIWDEGEAKAEGEHAESYAIYSVPARRIDRLELHLCTGDRCGGDGAGDGFPGAGYGVSEQVLERQALLQQDPSSALLTGAWVCSRSFRNSQRSFRLPSVSLATSLQARCLIFVMGSLEVPIFAPAMFYMLEFFVGLIQAIVFGMLTMTFMAQATQGHGDHEEAHT